MKTARAILYAFPLISLLGHAQQPLGSISGRVLTKDQKPIARATVRAAPSDDAVITDIEGRFQLTGLALARHTVTVTAPGFNSGLRGEVDLAGQPEATIDFSFDAGDVVRESVVVTGSGTQELLVEAPVRTELISHDFIRSQAIRSLSEALVASVPGLRIENNCQNCGFSAIRLNGLEGPYTQVLEDGMPTVSGASMVYALDQLPTEFFENIEVVKGGNSSLYGPNAVAGVINMVRREPQQNFFQVDTQAAWNFGRPEQTSGAVAQFGNIGLGWSADFYYRGLRRTQLDIDRDGFSELTRRRSQAGGGTLFRRFFEGKARLTIGGSTLDEFRRGGSQFDLLPEHTYITEQLFSDRSAGFFRWNHSLTPSVYYNVSSSLSYLGRRSYYGADFDPNAYGATRNPLSITDVSLGAQLGRHTINSGFQHWFEHVADNFPGYARHIRQTFKNSGFYLQDQWRLKPRVVILAGARVDKSNLLDHAVVSPRANIRLGLTNSLNLRLGISTGFRAPQVFDEDLHVSSVGGEVLLIQRAAGLRHESSRSLTAALDYTGRLNNQPFTVGLNFFWTRLNDVFVLRETDRVIDKNRLFERTNGPGSRFRGVEANVSLQAARRFGLRGGWTLQQARYDEPEPIFGSLRYFRTPNRYGFIGADLDLPWKIDIINTLDFTGTMNVQHLAGYIDADRVSRSPWFTAWNVIASREFLLGGGDRRKLRLYVKGNNLLNSFQPDFDQGPLRDAKYIYGPLLPRGLVTGMTLSF